MYRNLPITILDFDCNNQAYVTYDKTYIFKGRKLYWNILGILNCHNCGNPDHMTNKYSYKSQHSCNSFSQLYDHFKPAQYRSKVFSPSKPTNTHNHSYADLVKPSSSTPLSSKLPSNKQNVFSNQKQSQTNK